MASKIRVKVGATEIEFEGSEEYMREELPKLIELVGDYAPQSQGEEDVAKDSDVLGPSGDASKMKLKMTSNTIATKMEAKSGSDLALAACAHLCLVKGNDTFTRANILAEMKLASNFYKQTFSNNLSSILKNLVKTNKLLETSQDTYALVSQEKTRLEALLGGA